MNDQATKIIVAAFADAQEVLLPSSGILSSHQAQPGRNIPGFGKACRITDRGKNGGCAKRPDPRNCHKASCAFVGIGDLLNVVGDLSDPGFEPAEIIMQIS